MKQLFETPPNHIAIVSHLDEVICTMLKFDIPTLIKILKKDAIVNDAEFIGTTKVNEVKYILEFNINGTSNFKIDLLICEIE